MTDQEWNADCINRFQTNFDGNMCRKEDNLDHSMNRARWHEFIPTVDQAGHTFHVAETRKIYLEGFFLLLYGS